MRHRLALCVTMAFFALAAADATAATVTYQSSDPGSASWFPTAAPVAGDLAESSTVTLVQGTTHAISGPFSNLTNGLGGNGTLATSWFSTNASPSNFDKVLMDFGTNKVIASVKSFSWQDFDNNDRRFPQVYQLYGSASVAPATDDMTLGGPTWDLLATVDSTTLYPYDGYFVGTGNDPDATPEQLAVSIAGNGGTNLGVYRYLLFRISVAADPDGAGQFVSGLSPFWSEIDVVEAPEPSTIVLVIAGATGLFLCHRWKVSRN